VFSANPIVIPFAITSPQNNDPEVADTWITVTGTCPTNGVNRIGFTNDCLDLIKSIITFHARAILFPDNSITTGLAISV
jgi:hypothetical protein